MSDITVTAQQASSVEVTVSASTSVDVTSPSSSSVTVTNKGPKGDTGATGATGPQGPAGTNGSDANALGGADQTLTGDRVIDVSGNSLTIKDGTDAKLTYNPTNELFSFTDDVQVTGRLLVQATSGLQASQIELLERALGGSNAIILKAPDTNLTSDVVFVLPDADGSAGQVIKTDGSGNLSFVNQTADTNTQLSTEEVQDIVGAMFTGNTETRIAATYEDSDGTIDLVVDDMTGTEVANDSSPQLGGNLDVNGNSIVSASGGDITIDPDGTGAIILRSDDIRFDGTGGVTTGQIKLYETSILSPQHFIAIEAPLSVTADTTLVLPDGAGSNGQVLGTNGSGTLSWVTVPTSNNPDFFGILELKTVGGTQGEFILYDNDNSNYISIKTPSVVSSNVDFILPGADGSANQVLKTDGGGNLSFDTVGDVIDNRKFTKTSNTDGDSNGDVVYIGGTTSMTTGALYHYKSDGTWELADADSAATCDGLLGIALGASSDTNGVLLRGMVTIDHDPGAVGDVLFVSTTAGDITSTAPSGTGDIVRIVGYCLDASNGQIWFNPDGAFVEVTA